MEEKEKEVAKEEGKDENCAKSMADNVIPILTFILGLTLQQSSFRAPASILGQGRSPINLIRLFTAAKIVNYRIDCALTIPKLFQGNIY